MLIASALISFAMMKSTQPAVVPHHRHHTRLVHSRTLHRSSRNARYNAALVRMALASPIRGSQESLLRQNLRVSQDELVRIQDDSQLDGLIQGNALVNLPDNNHVTFATNLPNNRRYCQPWTRSFVEDFSTKYYAEFHQQLMVTSAVRTVTFQAHLRRHNGNAAEIDGDLASPHLTGAAIDIAKRGMTRSQLDWARDYLLQAQNNGYIDVEEEFRQRVFHITVYRDYDLANPRENAAVVQPATALQHADIQQTSDAPATVQQSQTPADTGSSLPAAAPEQQ